MELLFSLAVIIFILAFSAIKIVPQQEAWIVERFGKYHQSMVAGLNFRSCIQYVDCCV